MRKAETPLQATKIEWAHAVWNPVTGCTPVSEGCEHCYARRFAHRLRGRAGYDRDDPFRVTFHPDRLDQPLQWKKPKRIFVCSMGDLFHPDVAFVNHVMQVIAECPRHTFLVLTKRVDRMVRWFKEWWRPDVRNRFKRGGRTYFCPRLFLRRPGCSECQYFFFGCLHGRKEWKDEAVTPNFRSCDHRCYFGHPESICDAFEWHKDSVGHGVAVEMNNGEISVRDEDCVGGFPGPLKNLWLGVSVENQTTAKKRTPALLDCPAALRFVSLEPLLGPIVLRYPASLSWVIVGGETGSGARPMKREWVRSIRNQCVAAGIPFFFKAWGPTKAAGRELDGRTWDEVPVAMETEG